MRTSGGLLSRGDRPWAPCFEPDGVRGRTLAAGRDAVAVHAEDWSLQIASDSISLAIAGAPCGRIVSRSNAGD
jgi:hypothetical protein